MKRDPAYYRARINVIIELLRSIPVSEEKNNDRILLRNGFVPGKLDFVFNESLRKQLKAPLQKDIQQPLSFTELCSFNTWFTLHPEKIAGVEYVTTSREFPLMIKGTKEEIIETISRGLHDNKDNRVRIIKAKAIAKLKLLELTQLSGTDDKIWISADEALWMARQRNMFPKVKSWYKKGRIANEIYKAKGYPELKLIDVGEGTLLLDFKYLTLSYFYGKHDELRIIKR
jgi:hypothetical protein